MLLRPPMCWIAQNAPALNAIIFSARGGCSSVVELRTVAPAVVGSNPTTHPKAQFQHVFCPS